jgi:PPE-repeat protein
MSVLAMDFGALPPEINSAKMYFGPGSGPMLAAAVAWDGLAAQLHSTAASYSSVISELEGSWAGPSAASMAAAAARYAAWLTGTATHAEQTAARAKAAAGAYEAAFAMTVSPPVIAANRALLAALVATNFLGQNTPAIAATEAHYGEMWAQDAAAMYGYAGSSASASTLTPYTPPAQTTNPAGQAAQGAAVAQASATSAGNAQSIMSAVPTTLQGLASPAASADPPSINTFLPAFLTDLPFFGDFTDFSVLDASSLTDTTISSFRNTENASYEIGKGPPEGKPWYPAPALPEPASATGLGAGLGGGLVSAPGAGLGAGPGAGLGGGAVEAGMGRATLVGVLSAPQSWAAVSPATQSVATALPGSGFSAAPEGGPGGMPGMPGMPTAGTGQGTRFAAPRYGVKLTVMARPVAVG